METMELFDLKIIDFGSSYKFDAKKLKINVDTIEYLPPEVLEYIMKMK